MRHLEGSQVFQKAWGRYQGFMSGMSANWYWIIKQMPDSNISGLRLLCFERLSQPSRVPNLGLYQGMLARWLRCEVGFLLKVVFCLN